MSAPIGLPQALCLSVHRPPSGLGAISLTYLLQSSGLLSREWHVAKSPVSVRNSVSLSVYSNNDVSYVLEGEGVNIDGNTFSTSRTACETRQTDLSDSTTSSSISGFSRTNGSFGASLE